MSEPLVVCVCDYWQRCHFHNRPSREAGDSSRESKSLRRMCIQVDAINGNYYLREFLQQKELALRLKRQHGVQLVWLSFEPPKRDTVDYRFADILAHTLWEHIEVEHLMSWLSTLGGGFSALGEQFERCAETAGKISLQQLKIGLRLGDPFLQARCKLYFSISLIQRGQLRAAKHLIREQYAFARSNAEKDVRLVRMCLGIWQRLSYEYEQRQMRKKCN
ncbi:uncharacterized protein F58A4.6 [Drosophila gunungcola]|uniref:CG12123-RA protein n=1 Tax=Drosophila gunungcola TaxID=103775 RepID=A0A9Q0BJD3_9MUSC|nr:uncharacterized protein F58A4.6 [Drosophila gunungcola]KAI8034327.1 hypothetical protein M5D96_012880 [Drosophila gunungcola]